MSATREFCVVGLVLFFLLCGHGGVGRVSGTGICNFKMGKLKQCNSVMKDGAGNPENKPGDAQNSDDDASDPKASNVARADSSAESPTADADADSPTAAADSPNDPPAADSPKPDFPADAVADVEPRERSAGLTAAAEDDSEAEGSDSDSSHAARSACCRKAMEADIDCLCSFFSQRVVTLLHVVENFVDKLLDMCDIKLHGCTNV